LVFYTKKIIKYSNSEIPSLLKKFRPERWELPGPHPLVLSPERRGEVELINFILLIVSWILPIIIIKAAKEGDNREII